MPSVGVPYPLTRSQHLIWTGQQLQPDEPLYNMAMTFVMEGPLNIEAFESAFARLVRDADALRITIRERNGVPHQTVNESIAHTLDVIDLSDDAEPDDALHRWQTNRAQGRFDTTVCLIDAALVILDQTRFAWFLNQHHLTTDAWSTAVLFQHLSTLYAAAISGALDEVAPLPSFLDYVEKEQRARESKAAERAATFWKETLVTQSAPSSFYRSIPAHRAGRTQRVACVFGPARTAALATLTADAPFAAITADLARVQAFATVYFAWLHRLSGEHHLAIGTPTHNRSAAIDKRTPGMYIEVFPLKVTVDDHDSFVSLYRKVGVATRQLLLNAPPGATNFEHQRAFDVVLNSITARYGDFAGMPMQSTWVHADHGDRNHLVRLQVEDFDESDELRLFFDVHEDVFDEHDAERAQRDFLTLFDAMLAAPDQSIQRVSLLDHDATIHKLALGAAPVQDAPPEDTVIDRIDAVAKRSPDDLAVRDGAIDVSHGELYRVSVGLSQKLAARGVTRGDRVVIALPRSARAVVAMLAVQRLGAAYVPIDLAYPAERIALMVSDANPTLVLHEGDARPAGVDDALPTMRLNVLDNFETTSSPVCSPDPDDIAYIIYTSGSTGRPKGVQITHRSLINYADWAARTYHGDTPAAWPLFSSMAFDLTVTSVFVPLIDGGYIVVYGDDSDAGDLVIRQVVDDNAVDVVKLTPAHLNLILPMDLSQSRLRKLIIGGEDLKVSLARSVSQA
ncbi:MAG: condensation domain-containing protein, partial [Pseudomonadota bacterium]